VVLHDFGLWVGPEKMLSATYVRVASSSSLTGGGDPISIPTISIDGACVHIEESPPKCEPLDAGESIYIDRAPITGTISRGSSGTTTSHSNSSQVGAGSHATAFKIDLFHAGYTTNVGVADVVLDIGYAESFVGEPLPTVTPTRTPTKTPTPTGTPSVFKGVMPGLSKDE
jgi:hypothetical protein